jgi:hypothetical protein
MNNPKLFVRLLSAACAGLTVCLLIVAVFPVPTRHVTFGQLATKSPATGLGLIRISNCGGFSQHGQFLVFAAGHESRYPVVFVLASADPVAPGVSVFAGSCAGIRVTPMTGCPCVAPFVLVTGVAAVIE